LYEGSAEHYLVGRMPHPPEIADALRDALGLDGQGEYLLEWADGQGLTWDKTDEPDGEHWVCRLEVYNDDPREQPDWSQWTSDLVFKLSDQ
jgi:hypothetical protein